MTGMEDVLAAHQIVSRSNCDCGQRLTFGPFKPLKTHAEAYAAHVAQALADAGFGSRPEPATVAPFGFDVTTGMIQEVWDCWVKPVQDADLPQSAEMRVLMAILRNAFKQAEAREGAS